MDPGLQNEISRCVKIYKTIAATPSPSGAKIIPAVCDDALCIHTLWSSQDFVEFQKNKFSRDFVIEKESFKVLSSGIPSDVGSILLHGFSKSGRKRAVLTEKKSPEKKTYLEIWNGSKKEAAFDMSERKEHGNITDNDPFKCFEWSSDEKFILYAAEEKQPKSVSYFADTSQAKDETDNIIKGEEFVYREEWGEACVGSHHTVLCILEIETGLVQVLPTSKIGSDFSFGQARWGPNDETVIFIGWKEFPYRLGVWACRNRRSALYAINLESKDIECLTPDDNICVRSPRFSPNLDTLIYLENSGGGPHFKGAKLRKYDWKTKNNSTVVDLVENATGDEFPGIYVDYLPSRCWSEDGKYVYFSTIWRSRVAILCVDIENGKLQKVQVDEQFGSSVVLDVHYNMLVAELSAPNIDPCLVIGRIDAKNRAVIAWNYLDSHAPVIHSDIKWNIKRLTPTVPNEKYSDLDYEIIVISPTEMQNKCPLIIMPHGGPHSCFPAGFLSRRIGFVKLGYVLCIVNYRGSVGFGENNLNSLPGNIGTQDVADVQDFYKAAVLLNPVIDVSNMTGITDIPDWNWVEGGFGDDFDLSTVVKPDHLKAMWEKSPISHLENVRAPTLLLLGKKDLRVPMSQGIKYYQLLKARKVPVRVYQYDDNHQLLKTPHDGDHFMQAALWFYKHSS
ncbi:Acylamino-acid-releasing enzyme [Araneus ventricosus]|uniref:Acylamino-acid-releasing enzyme n=1 Tax=Araneus ventricosus TaxID=182803 RepID=A0A4Y2KBH3_ARAVE|nr:Acylamino-acid-releasing enzyme [Araneus ventricosus]